MILIAVILLFMKNLFFLKNLSKNMYNIENKMKCVNKTCIRDVY